jgi:hypothetical protein
MLLSLASAVFLGSEPFCTRDHILLSQIRDFPFRRLLRLAGSPSTRKFCPAYNPSARTTYKNPASQQYLYSCARNYCTGKVFTESFPSNDSLFRLRTCRLGTETCLPSRCLETGLHATLLLLLLLLLLLRDLFNNSVGASRLHAYSVQ